MRRTLSCVFSGLLAVGCAAEEPASSSIDLETRATEIVVLPCDSIQAAVDRAMPGDRVLVYGQHLEQVTIDKDLTLAGAPGARIAMPPPPLSRVAVLVEPEEDFREQIAALIAVTGGNVTITGFDLDGRRVAATEAPIAGVLFHRADGVVRDCEIHDFAGRDYPLLDPAWSGSGVLAVNDLDDVRHVAVEHSRVRNFNSSGIEAFGLSDDANAPTVRLRVRVEDSQVIGAGPSDTIEQFGILVFRGAVGEIKHNMVRDLILRGHPGGHVGTGIFGRFGDRYLVEDNVLIDVQDGIVVGDVPHTTIRGNSVVQAPPHGAGYPTGIITWGEPGTRMPGAEISDNVVRTFNGSGDANASNGIIASGGHSRVLRNRVTMGGESSGISDGYAWGIAFFDGDNLAQGNVVTCEVSGPALGAPALLLSLFGGHDRFVDNLVTGPGAAAGLTYGLDLFEAEDTSASGNDFVDLATGVLVELAWDGKLSGNRFTRVGTQTVTLDGEAPASHGNRDRAEPRPGRR